MNTTLTRRYRANIRPLHLENISSYSSRLLAANHDTNSHGKYLLKEALSVNDTGTHETLWATIIENKTGRSADHLLASTSLPKLNHLKNTGAGIRFLCTRCAGGAAVMQFSHFTANVCLKHNRWVGPGTGPREQHTVSADVAAAERKFRKILATNLFDLSHYRMIHRALNSLSVNRRTVAERNAFLYPTVVRLAAMLVSYEFSLQMYASSRSYANCYQYLLDSVSSIVPNNAPEVSRVLWLYLRSTFLEIREIFGSSPLISLSRKSDFFVHPSVLRTMFRPIGPEESFSAFLVPTADNKLDKRTLTRPDSYSVLRNICRHGHRLSSPLTLSYKKNVQVEICPVCEHRVLRPGVNDLATTHPVIAAQLHPTLNGAIDATTIFASSHKKLWWQCEKPGHVFEATASNRCSAASGCPVCLNRVIIIGINDLATLYPEVAQAWHPTKNHYLSVEKVAAGSNELVWWVCKSGHSYRTTIGNRTRGAQCHYCTRNENLSRTLANARPDLAAEMHQVKNGNFSADNITIGSRRNILWICSNNHEYVQRPERRNAGYGCPICSGRKLVVGVNDIQSRYPEISSEWHSSKNGPIEPCDLVPGIRKFWWRCKVAGHEYEQTAPHRVSSQGCPKCPVETRIARHVCQ